MKVNPLKPLHLFIDDFGTGWYSCRYTKEIIPATEGTTIGSTVPNVKVQYVMKNTEEAKALHKQSQVIFHESEANCNTCLNLERVKHTKCKFSFVQAKCRIKPEAGIMKIHPEDPMKMQCYVSRFSRNSNNPKVN